MSNADERAAHHDEIVKVARKLIADALPPLFGQQNPHLKALKEEVQALDDWDARHREGASV